MDKVGGASEEGGCACWEEEGEEGRGMMKTLRRQGSEPLWLACSAEDLPLSAYVLAMGEVEQL